MRRRMMKSKIHRATVTDANLHYIGSISLDPRLMELSDILGALDRAADLFRRFREQPTPELARSAGAGLAASLSLNERLQQLWLPWTSYVIVPLFALANAGIVVDGAFLMRAARPPVTCPLYPSAAARE